MTEITIYRILIIHLLGYMYGDKCELAKSIAIIKGTKWNILVKAKYIMA